MAKTWDKNTKFFHRTATSHRMFNFMEQLELDGTTIQDPKSIKEVVQNYNNDLYKETKNWRHEFSFHEPSRINEEEHICLQRDFEEEEIPECLNMCAMEKAPRPFNIFTQIRCLGRASMQHSLL